MKSIFKRYSKNPILRPEDMPSDCFAVYNGGVVKTHGGYIALVRTEDSVRYQRVWCARSSDGYRFFPDPEPVRFIADDMEQYRKYTAVSFFDPRINPVEGKFYITYAAYTFRYGCRIGIGETEDFRTVRHISFPHHVQNRNAVLFPEKINDMYVMLHRPETGGIGNLWISRSPDLRFWGDCEVVADRGSGRWDSIKIGAGTPPLKTSRGWLVVTHAVDSNCSGQFYTVGAVLLDLQEPSKLVARSRMLMCPEMPYETNGFAPNVVFPCGAVPEPDGSLKLYYGAADNFECLAETTVQALLDECHPV